MLCWHLSIRWPKIPRVTRITHTCICRTYSKHAYFHKTGITSCLLHWEAFDLDEGVPANSISCQLLYSISPFPSLLNLRSRINEPRYPRYSTAGHISWIPFKCRNMFIHLSSIRDYQLSFPKFNFFPDLLYSTSDRTLGHQ